ncbi:ankyrin repeat-containing domain protein [Baffinella frigidus]|nr:ankyrin repeat-containing domain protein [Cryptophyta sp. CCMP2293]
MLRGAGGQADAERERIAEALCRAAGRGEIEEVRRLIAGGADVLAKNSDGFTALHHAANNGYEGLVMMLLGAGADVAAKTSGGRTALHFAAINGHEGVAKVLLDAGAGVAAKDSGGHTALNWAVMSNGHARLARMLRDAGAAQAASDAARRTEKTLDLAKKQKEKGNAEYQKLSYAMAAEAYSKAIRLTEMLKPPLSEEQQAAARALKLQCLVQIRPSICTRGRRKSTPLCVHPPDPKTMYRNHGVPP